jgi:ribonuclease P protein component
VALTFPKTFRFQRSSEFLRVKTAGRAYSGRFMTVGVLKECATAKVGLITSKRVGGAVERNRVRRRLRELMRETRPQWAPGVCVVVIARRAAVKASFEALRGEWLYLAKRAGVLVPSETERDPHA